MKTTKTAFFKKAIAAGIMVVLFIVSAAFITKTSETKPVETKAVLKASSKITDIENRYYVVTAVERTKDYSKTNGYLGAEVVSNVATFDCETITADSFREGRVRNNFYKYYMAEYSDNRECDGLDRIVAIGYKIYEEAENHRREMLALFKQRGTPFVIHGFTTSCKD